MGQRGGKREGAGRKPGSNDKFKRAQAEAIAASGLTPLEYMLAVLRDAGAEQAMRFEAAKAAAPYCHPRLSSVTMDANVASREMSREEIDQRLALLGVKL